MGDHERFWKGVPGRWWTRHVRRPGTKRSLCGRVRLGPDTPTDPSLGLVGKQGDCEACKRALTAGKPEPDVAAMPARNRPVGRQETGPTPVLAHRAYFPEQYEHPLCGRRVEVAGETGTVWRVVPSRFGPLVLLTGNPLNAYSIEAVKVLDEEN